MNIIYSCIQPVVKSQARARRFSIGRLFEPLRILFCGSDDFSIASLKALHAEQIAKPEIIKSIDVVSKVGKRFGRGLKTVREVPIVATATELSLPLHQIDTFTRWQPPQPNGEDINLIIAVSFGLFVPPRILNGAKYGGLNVHPSILPDFRGSAPLHHTLLAGCRTTGISLQTLHPQHFDHGVILAQTPLPGFNIPSANEIGVQGLLEIVAPRAAEMLIQGLRDRVYVPPLKEIDQQSEITSKTLTRPAKRITSEDRHINWTTWTSEQILTRNRVLGPLWNNAARIASTDAPHKRIIWTSGFRIVSIQLENLSPGVAVATLNHGGQDCIYIKTIDDLILEAELAKTEGEQTGPARLVARKAKLINDQVDPKCQASYTAFELS